jgi:uncharacterized protein
MTVIDAVLLLIAAVGAGAMNAVVGAGTLITFPTLLALGVPPVVANVSNTVGLVPGSVAGAYAFRATLVGRAALIRRLLVASSVGGVTGGALLLILPPGALEVVIPPLLLLSAVLAAIQPRVARAVALRRAAAAQHASSDTPAAATATPLLLVGITATGVYGGYFGAAQGVVLLALLGVFLEGGMTQLNGIKNILAGVANLVSALLFIAIADVDWRIVAIVAVGATIGGGLGGRYGRRLPSKALRVFVVLVAVIAAVWQLID